MRVKVIQHDGHEDWTVSQVSEVEVSIFSVEELMRTQDPDWEPNLYDQVVTYTDVVSVMGEESGFTFVNLTH